MRLRLAVLSFLLIAFRAQAADPMYIDQLIETPLATLQSQFPNLKKEGCYRIGESRYLLISADPKKEHKPWRIALTSVEPCRRSEDIPPIDVQERSGIRLGDSTISVVKILGRPDASAPPEQSLKKLGDTEFFFICRVSEGCARHTSIFLRDGLVSGIAEWYSE
jgi:hypothetical protein